jgi:hypothetical protein
MGRREDFDNALWSDPEFLALAPEARMTYIWSWTNPRCGMAGIYKVAPAQAALETGYPADVVTAAFGDLGASGFAFYEAHVVFVRTRCRRLRTKSQQIAKSVRNDLMAISDDHPLKAQFLSLYADQTWLAPYIGEGRASVNGDSGEVQGSATARASLSLTEGSPEARSTLPGNGNGNGKGYVSKGWGAGRGNRRENPDLGPGYQASAEAIALRDEHFPDELLGSIDSVLAKIRLKRLPETPAMVRALLGREEAA